MAYECIEVKEESGVLVITMNDSATRNSIGTEMAAEMGQELDRLESDPNLRTLVLTGRDPSFCSGANVKRMAEGTPRSSPEPSILSKVSPWELLEQRWGEQSAGGAAEEMDGVRFMSVRLYNLQKPSIAAVNGFAMGLGLGLALSCDIRIVSENAKLSETFIRRGLIPADGSCWQLPRMIGLGNTLLLQYTGDPIDAEEALRLGMVNKVTPHGELMETAMALARRLAESPTYTMALAKRLVHASLHVEFEESMKLAGPAQVLARQTEDYREGVRAFVEKRKPAFKGR